MIRQRATPINRELLKEVGIGLLGAPIGFAVASLISVGQLWVRITIGLIAGIIGALIVWIVSNEKRSVSGPVEIFLPQWNGTYEGDFYQDGTVQWQGFEQGRNEGRGIHNALDVRYNPMLETSTATALLESMQQRYKEGSTYFIMTMSSKAEEVLSGFKAWHQECLKTKAPLPVLIVTVASAPELADANNGVVRWYIRSEEESQVLANCLERLVDKASTFGITHTPGNCDSTYGAKGVERFCHYFDKDVPADLKFYVTGHTAKDAVKKFLTKCRSESNDLAHGSPASAWPGVFIVGYGDMVKNTLTELIESGYAGYIACTSTFSDPQWRPAQKLLAASKAVIFTVRPLLKNPKEFISENDKNIVFFFARKTLLRVLRLTAGNIDSQTFLSQWTGPNEEGPQAIDQIYTKEGDIQVQVKVVDARNLYKSTVGG